MAKGGTVVGLNIGNAFIKAVEVTSKGGQLSVTGMGVIATPPESYNNGNVLSVTALSGAIRSMWKQAGLSSKSTVFSVAGTGSLVVRVIEVPKMSDGELADNMKVDADRYIPFPPSEVVMEAKALRDLPNDPDAANMEVLLAAAQREIIDLHVSVVQKAKLSPRAIDVEPLALARVLQLDLLAQNPIVDYDDVTAVLNIGQTGTEITIMRGDIVVFTRSVPNGGGNLTSAIAESMGIPTSDAERLKIERGDALPPAGYAEGTGDDDFGFGDFNDGGGSATVDFSGGGFDDDFGADAVSTSARDGNGRPVGDGESGGSNIGRSVRFGFLRPGAAAVRTGRGPRPKRGRRRRSAHCLLVRRRPLALARLRCSRHHARLASAANSGARRGSGRGAAEHGRFRFARRLPARDKRRAFRRIRTRRANRSRTSDADDAFGVRFFRFRSARHRSRFDARSGTRRQRAGADAKAVGGNRARRASCRARVRRIRLQQRRRDSRRRAHRRGSHRGCSGCRCARFGAD